MLERFPRLHALALALLALFLLAPVLTGCSGKDSTGSSSKSSTGQGSKQPSDKLDTGGKGHVPG